MTGIFQEFGVVLCGNLFIILVFCLLIGLAKILQKIIIKAPILVYKFVASFGISTVLDAIFLLFTDLIIWVYFYHFS